MGYVAATAGCFALGAHLARDASAGWAFVGFIAALACLIAMNVARRSGGASVGLLLAFGARRLVSVGFTDSEAATVSSIMGKHPDTRLRIAAALDLGAGETTRQNPYVQSVWMFVTDLFAAAVPVIPFALFDLATARLVSLAVTFVLLVMLGIGRAWVGHRRIMPTVTQTVGIAMAAAVAGLAVGKLIS